METIQTEIGSCMNLALLARQLGLINIKGVSFADLFILFPSADLFCGEYLLNDGLYRVYQKTQKSI